MEVRYKLESFEGPLDLLLHLIDKNEVDIYDIPIAQITDQYMEYIARMPELEMDATSEFLVMAATLLAIKSRMLLPKPPAPDPIGGEDDGVDPREELVQKLLEYRKYKTVAELLRDKELARSLIYSREPADLSAYVPERPDPLFVGVTPADLAFALQRVLSRTQKRETVARIRRDEISVKDRIRELLVLLRNKEGRVLFSRLFGPRFERDQIVVTFLALLELMKNGLVSCYQHKVFDDIVIQYRGGGQDDGSFADEIDY